MGQTQRWTIAIAWIAICILNPQVALAADEQPVIPVNGPTVVAFFPPVTEAELEQDPDTNETLADFQYYTSRVRETFAKSGIEFHELYVRSFQLSERGKLITFRPAKTEIGYYFVAPGKEPQIEYGVMTDIDLLEVAKGYFGVSAR